MARRFSLVSPVLRLMLVLVPLILFSTSVASVAQVLTTLYSFQSAPDAIFPSTPLVFDAAGNLYGASANGGSSICEFGLGCGTIFELSPPPVPGGAWTEQVIYSFKSDSDGWSPLGQLAVDKNGNLYGTTY